MKETNEAVADGFLAIYVNTAVDDGTRIAKLMQHFLEADFADGDFPELSRRIAELKHDEREVTSMCQSVQDYADKVALEEKLHLVCELVSNGDISLEKGAEKLGISEMELEKAMTEYGYIIPATV